MLRWGILTAVIAILLAIAGIECAKRISTHDLASAQLSDAITRARKSLPEFEARLRRPNPDDRAFFVRAHFSESGNGVELLWVRRVTPDKNGFKGVLAEEPFKLKQIHLGDEVSVPSADVVDWTIRLADGSKAGNFTSGLEPDPH